MKTMTKFKSCAGKFICIGLVIGFFPAVSFSQDKLSGRVVNAISGEKIQGASVAIENSFVKTITDVNGNFSFPLQQKENTVVHVTHISYRDTSIVVKQGEHSIEIRMLPGTILADEVNIVATRAGDQSAMAFTNLKKEEIEKQNLGQDLPYLLNLTPSVVVTSDAGAGVGYTGIRIRGSDATRVNVTINGIPVNDAEGLLVYWVDLPDFASSVDNIQIQRGIGTSTNGAGAFGGSVNIQTSKLSTEPFALMNSSYGSFRTMKNTVQFGTGLLNTKFALEGRLSKITSDGYIDRATSDLKSFYLSGGYYGKKSSLRLIVFSGKEKTYQAWYGVPQEKLNGNPDSLLNHYYNNLGYLYVTPKDSVNLFNANNRTYNYYSYNNQTDNYQQDYYQLHYSYELNSNFNLNTALHYTKGKGYYEEYKPQQNFSDYHLDTLFIGSDTIASTDLIRQRWLDNDFYGFTFSGNYEKNALQITVGGAANRYMGRHYDEIIWAKYASNKGINDVYRDNDATKDDVNFFAKTNYKMNASLNLFGDIQFRTVQYSFLGLDDAFNHAQQQVEVNFFNPKVGLNYRLNASSRIYGSVAIGHKEPVREDYTGFVALNRPKPEEMTDVETGYSLAQNKFRAAVNFYYMTYKNQLVLTGRINDVGEYPRQNVDQSRRAGMEIEFDWNILKNLKLTSNLTISENKIESLSEYVDSSDDVAYYPQAVVTHKNTDISFSPDVIGAAVIAYSPIKNFTLELVSKYVGKQFLDNTSNKNRMLDAYYLNDVRLNYRIATKLFKEVSLKFAVYNLLDKKYQSNGYSYSYYYDGMLYTQNYYYPQAGRNWLAGVSIKF